MKSIKHDNYQQFITAKKLNNFLFLFCMTLILSGCVGSQYSVPEDNVDFAKIEHLSDLNGTYQNQSEGASEQPTYYLSSLIWPEEKIDPNTIWTIEVKAINGNTIQVKGIRANTIVKKSILVEGEDFHLSSGRISIQQQAGLIPSETKVVGIHSGSRELGLDEQGHGKLKESYFMTGLAVMVIPIAFSGGNEVRFKRIK